MTDEERVPGVEKAPETTESALAPAGAEAPAADQETRAIAQSAPREVVRPGGSTRIEAFGVEFADHDGFQRGVLRALAGGAAGGLAAHLMASLVGAPDFFPFFVFTSTIGALAAFGSRVGGWLGALRAGALGLLGGVLHTVCADQWPWLGALLLGTAAAPVLARGEPVGKLAVTGAMAGLFAYGG